MVDTKRKVPNLRFKGFTNDWEQRKLGEIGKTQSGIGFPNKEQGGQTGIPFFKVSDMNNQGNEFEMVTSNNYVTDDQIVTQKWKPITEVPAVIFAKVGAALMLNRKRLIKMPFLIDNNTMAYIFNQKWDPYFGKILFDTLYLPKYAQTGALPSFNESDIKGIRVKFPNLNEQQVISQFFQNVNNLISLQQRKLELLKQLKKGFLQKLFADENEKQPVLRFNGFTGDWEQCKLGEVGKIVGGGTPSTKLPSYWNGSINWYTPAEISDFVYTNHSKKTITYDGLKHSSAQLLPKGTVLFTSRAGIGKTAILSKEGATNQGFQSIIPNKKLLNSYFIFSLTSQLKRYGETHGAGSTFVEVSGKELAKAPIKIPELSEQQKISTLNKKIDGLIALQQSTLNELALLKKFFLQKMFI